MLLYNSNAGTLFILILYQKMTIHMFTSSQGLAGDASYSAALALLTTLLVLGDPARMNGLGSTRWDKGRMEYWLRDGVYLGFGGTAVPL